MNNPIRIGIVGGGQLGKMLVQAAKKLGFFVAVIDPTPQSPGGQIADKQIIADYKDEKAIRKLAKLTDIITFEIELANDKVLYELQKKGKIIHPSPKTLGVIRDKLRQKQFLKSHHLPTAPFSEIKINSDLNNVIKKWGFPFFIKARTDSYDGRGNALIKTELDITKGLEKLKGRLLYVEKFIPFVKELAIMVARNTHGDVAVYPVVETIHKNNICDTVLVPAKISKNAVKNAQRIAKTTMEHLEGAGVFGIEMFLTKDDEILINEIAPRVHNSGHYTIEATVTSQFEQHIRAISGLSLGSTEMIINSAVMKNILATKDGPGIPKGIAQALKIPGVSLHIYGKHESRPERKMGHITVVGNTVEECFKKANKARKVLII